MNMYMKDEKYIWLLLNINQQNKRPNISNA